MKPDVEQKGEPNRKPHHPQKLHLDNCTSNDPRTGQLRNGVLGAGGRTKGRQKAKHTWKVTRNNWSQDESDEKIKLIRAQGGCPGTIRRRRSWQAAKSYGEPQAGFDP